MNIATISLGAPMLITLIWAVVQEAKKRIPNFNTDWCWVLACGLGVLVSMAGAVVNPTRAGLEQAVEQGLILGVAAVGLHSTGSHVPAVLQDIIQLLNFKNFGTAIDVPEAAGLPPTPPSSEVPPLPATLTEAVSSGPGAIGKGPSSVA